jgi:hypothetical protein
MYGTCRLVWLYRYFSRAPSSSRVRQVAKSATSSPRTSKYSTLFLYTYSQLPAPSTRYSSRVSTAKYTLESTVRYLYSCTVAISVAINDSFQKKGNLSQLWWVTNSVAFWYVIMLLITIRTMGYTCTCTVSQKKTPFINLTENRTSAASVTKTKYSSTSVYPLRGSIDPSGLIEPPFDWSECRFGFSVVEIVFGLTSMFFKD